MMVVPELMGRSRPKMCGHGRTGCIGSYAYDCITRSHDNCMMTMSSLNDFHYSHPWLGPIPRFSMLYASCFSACDIETWEWAQGRG